MHDDRDDDHDMTIDFMCPELSPAEAREASETLELLLTLGADVGSAKQKVAELRSPPRVTTKIARLPSMYVAPGETFDLH